MNIVTKTGKDSVRFFWDRKIQSNIDDRWRAKINKGPAGGAERTGPIKRVAAISDDIEKLHKAYGPLQGLRRICFAP